MNFIIENFSKLFDSEDGLNYVGVSCIFDSDESFIYPDLMMKIKASEKIINKYLFIVLSSDFVREYYRKNAKGTSKSMPKINQKIVLNTLIPLPPLEEQKKIVKVVDQLMVFCDSLEKQVEKSKNEMKTLLETI